MWELRACCACLPVCVRVNMFAGVLNYWIVGYDEPVAKIMAHEGSIWDMDWHPVGHVLVTGVWMCVYVACGCFCMWLCSVWLCCVWLCCVWLCCVWLCCVWLCCVWLCCV